MHSATSYSPLFCFLIQFDSDTHHNPNTVLLQLGDDTALYCVCRQPHTDGVLMLGCDACDAWFHPHCLGLRYGERNLQLPRHMFCDI